MVKQVIVIRKDLRMRRGKEIAQGAHAAMAWMTNRARKGYHYFSPEEEAWINGPFTKICLQVNSLPELNAVYVSALEAGLTTELIIDSGATEFNNVPTETCCAIGPHEASKIDAITGHLKLY